MKDEETPEPERVKPGGFKRAAEPEPAAEPEKPEPKATTKPRNTRS